MKKIFFITISLFVLLFLAPAYGDIVLSDIVGGGDGTGTAPVENVGINPDTGQFATAHMGAIWNTDDPLAPVPDSEFIDSVFIIAAEETSITTTGVTHFFNAEDIITNIDPVTLEETPGGGYDVISKDSNPDRPGEVFAGTVSFETGIGIHASAGITFDLDAIRAAQGDNAVKYISTVAGGDNCVTLNVDLYMILSSETEELDTITFHSLADQATFMQSAIPAEAKFLTLVTAASNATIECDHGTFAEAMITAEPVDDTIDSISLVNFPGALAGGTPFQVEAIEKLNSYGALVMLPGVEYSSSDDSIFDVSPEGLVTPHQIGSADLTVKIGAMELTKHTLVGIDLGGIAAGSNGFEPPDPATIGINQDTGQWATARSNANVTNTSGFNPQPVDDSSFINCVFLLQEDSMAINLTEAGELGITYDFEPGSAWGNGWENILNGWEPGGPDLINLGSSGIFHNGIGIHASAGITYDLNELRDEHGEEAVKYFYTVAGEGAGQVAPTGQPVNVYVILSNDAEILGDWSVLSIKDGGKPIAGEIPAEAKYITFATGATGNGVGSAHGCFGQAVILSEPFDTSISEINVTPESATLRAGDEYQLSVNGITGLTGIPVDLTADASYQSSDTNVVTVSDSGLLSIIANGQASITISYEDLQTELTVEVVDNPFSELVVSPSVVAIQKDETLQLAVTATREFDSAAIDVTGEVTYESSDSSIANVDDAGLVTGSKSGSTEITITLGTLELKVPAVVMHMIDLGQIAGGGDGSLDNPPLHLGINADTGMFSDNLDLNAVNPTGDNPQAVDTSALGYDFIDSVFIMTTDTMIINTAGGFYDFMTGDSNGSTWDVIGDTIEPDSTQGTLQIGPMGTFIHGITIHASSGITFDLEELRDYYGEDSISFFSAIAGEGSIQAGGSIDCYIILADSDGNVIGDPVIGGPYTDNGEFFEVPIPAEASFLTLATGDANNGIGADHGLFGDAFITSCSIVDPTNCGGNPVEKDLFKRGDVNTDGAINLADAITLLSHLFAGSAAPVCADAADTNNDETLNLADAISILSYLFAGAADLPDPFMTCGEDTNPAGTENKLDCQSFSPCE